jgi:hypothetical protein
MLTCSTSSTTRARTPRARARRYAVALVVFDAGLSCRVRLDRQTARHDQTRLVTLESLGSLAT